MCTETISEDPSWQSTDLNALAQTAVKATLKHLGFDPAQFEVAVLGCDDRRITELNTDFRDKPSPTNVLSWPSETLHPGDVPSMPELGDIAIAFDTCQREAREQGKPFEAHVLHLLVHATLHLLGYDHINDADAEEMEAKEREIMTSLGLPDPYL